MVVQAQYSDTTIQAVCAIEQKAVFKGENATYAFPKYFYSHIDSAKLLAINDTGRIIITFIIEKDGLLNNIEINFGKDESPSPYSNYPKLIFDDDLFMEIRRVISSSATFWEAGKVLDQSARQQWAMIIQFPLKPQGLGDLE